MTTTTAAREGLFTEEQLALVEPTLRAYVKEASKTLTTSNEVQAQAFGEHVKCLVVIHRMCESEKYASEVRRLRQWREDMEKTHLDIVEERRKNLMEVQKRLSKYTPETKRVLFAKITRNMKFLEHQRELKALYDNMHERELEIDQAKAALNGSRIPSSFYRSQSEDNTTNDTLLKLMKEWKNLRPFNRPSTILIDARKHLQAAQEADRKRVESILTEIGLPVKTKIDRLSLLSMSRKLDRDLFGFVKSIAHRPRKTGATRATTKDLQLLVWEITLMEWKLALLEDIFITHKIGGDEAQEKWVKASGDPGGDAEGEGSEEEDKDEISEDDEDDETNDEGVTLFSLSAKERTGDRDSSDEDEDEDEEEGEQR